MTKPVENAQETTQKTPSKEIQDWQQNEDGTWSEAIPEPLFVGWRLRKCLCDCGVKFKTRTAYRDHYRLVHTDGRSYKRTPKGMVAI